MGDHRIDGPAPAQDPGFLDARAQHVERRARERAADGGERGECEQFRAARAHGFVRGRVAELRAGAVVPTIGRAPAFP